LKLLCSLLSVLPLLAACGGAPSKPPSTGQASPATKEVQKTSYFVRVQGREQLLGTRAPDGALTRNPELPTGDEDADGAALSKALSVTLDADGRPLPAAAQGKTDEPKVTWLLGDDGSVTARVALPAALASPPMMFRRGFRVLPDGSAVQAALGISYLLRDDGTVVQRFRDGREEVEPRWRVQSSAGTSKRRLMVGLVILDDFFDTGGGLVH
jgi:hypothetical protein